MKNFFPFHRFRFTTLVAAVLLAVHAGAATIPVTTTADGVAGSLRAAIQNAQSGDTIVFQIPSNQAEYNDFVGDLVYVIKLFGQTAATKALVINKDLTIDGTAQKIVVHRDAAAPPDFRIFDVTSGRVLISHIWVSNGNLTDKTGPLLGIGAGIRNHGNLTVRDCIFTGNAVDPGGGGAVANYATLLVRNSTFSGNTASGGGGAIFNIDTAANATIIGCTFNANSGGAILQGGSGSTLTVRSCTVYGNTGYPGLYNVSGSAFVQNTIVAGNTGGSGSPDVQGTFTSGGYNLIGNNAGSSGFSATGDRSGFTPAQMNLAPLSYYGGDTPTMLPLAGSEAIDKGKRSTDENGQLINTDQRGLPRPIDRSSDSNAPGGDTSDVGAVEVGLPQPGPTFTVTTTDERIGECTTDDCTLLEALTLANAMTDANTINFAPVLALPNNSIYTNTITPEGLPITNPVTINGPGARAYGLLSGRSAARIFNVSAQNVTIAGLSMRNGSANNANANGGAIYNSGGLTLTDCLIISCYANSGNGGGIFNAAGAGLTLVRCEVTAGTAGMFGGGVYSDGTLTATNSTFYLNRALRGGGIISRAAEGASRMTLRNCTVTGNTATDGVNIAGWGGGGVFAEGNNTQYFVANNIIAGNFATNDPDIRGNYTSEGSNLIGAGGDANGFANGGKGDKVGTVTDPLLARFDSFDYHGGQTRTWSLLSNSPAINAGNDSLAPPTDQRGYGRNGASDIGAFEFSGVLPVTLANISTRLRVEAGDNALIGGFIVTGTQPKKVIVRAIGPSLPFTDKLANPTLELHGPNGLIEANDNWINSPNKQAIIDTTIPPSNDLESAIVANLPANGAGYTAIVPGVNGETGMGVVEAYDLDRTVDSKLANISTRGLVSTGDNVLIAGTIVIGQTSQKVLVRAIGPSLPIAGKLENPTLELRDANGGLIRGNDNWRIGGQEQEIMDTTIPPANDFESAIVATLPANGASYTAIVRGVNASTGIAVVEIYALN